jgi:hypothetical protein
MKMKWVFATILLSLVAMCNVGLAQTQGAGVDSYIESLRADLRADRVAIITEAMQFNDQESKIFWPVYRKYETEVANVNDQRVALIKSYADKYTKMTDADAKQMISQALDFESRRTDVTKKYAKELQKAGISALTVARFIQLEHRLNLIVDVELAYEIPWVTPAGQTSSNQ